MDQYPTEEEEFELMYQDEFELLREQEDLQPAPKSRKCLDFSQSNSQHTNASEVDLALQTQQEANIIKENTVPVLNISVSTSATHTQTSASNKRSIEELFGDIDDILSEGIFKDAPLFKKKKKTEKVNADLALIEQIVQLRNSNKEHILPASSFGRDYTSVDTHNREHISLIVPKYPFIGLTNHDGERVYVRCHSEEYEADERLRVAKKSSFIGVMGSTFRDIWKQATIYINEDLERATSEAVPTSTEEILPVEDNKDLWVDIYKPRKYYELLSDESTNRSLLKWLKLWDKAVFNRKPKIKMHRKDQHAKNSNTPAFQKFQKQELSLELESDGRPKFKVALLCGTPGLGKTTLAHMVAKHCGYNVVEINASDDRNLDHFKNALENATSMRSVLDLDKRPNCLVFDEIDGAPINSIEYLIKFINGTESGKRGKKSQKPTVLKRPIICICNDVYVPALRSLRQISFIVNFPPTTSSRLAERLNEISRYQNIKTDMGALLALAEKTHNDIRSCLSILHFFKTQNKPVTLTDIWKTSIGQKDMQKGLFAVWQDIFQIERPKSQQPVDKRNITLKDRSKTILNTVQSFGDYERLTQGVFENFPNLQVKDSTLQATVEAEEWFCFTDLLNSRIMSQQDYSLGVYLPFGFVMWHFVFAGLVWPKIAFPNAAFEARTKAKRQEGLIGEILKGMQPFVRAYVQRRSLMLEILPFLNQIIIPPFRPVNLHLYTEREKEMLRSVVSIMIDYNLNYIQERTLEGNFVYNLDPNMDEIVVFPGFKPLRALSYHNKQMVSQEIELEKMRRIEGHKHAEAGKKQGKDEAKKEGKREELPNHLQKLQVKTLKPKAPAVTKDFFGRIIVKERTEGQGRQSGGDIWYQFKEGFTNAVRKPIKVKFLK